MNDLPQRKNIRLKNFDYSSNGAYFITICVIDRQELLGKIDVEAIITPAQNAGVRPPDVGAISGTARLNRPQSVGAIINRPPEQDVGAIIVPEQNAGVRPQSVGAIINRPPEQDVGVIIESAQNAGVRPPIRLSEYGDVTQNAINEIEQHYRNIILDQYVIMPNHIHMILFIYDDGNDDGNDGRRLSRAVPDIAPTNISVVIQQLKRHISKQIGFSLWQKSYYDHIIRDEEDYQNHLRYIEENPAKWAEDEYFIRL